MTSNEDFNREEAKLFAKRLTELGINVEYWEYGSKENPLGHVFHCNIKTEAAKMANDEECAFFKPLCENF